jgi:hypothetical protein
MSTDGFTRDPELAATLRGALGDVPEPDWDRLRASVAARAELPLARRRRGGRVLGLSGRVRTLVPLAAAAGIAGAALAVTLGPSRQTAPLTPDEVQAMEAIVDHSLQDVNALVTGEVAREQLLDAAVGS